MRWFQNGKHTIVFKSYVTTDENSRLRTVQLRSIHFSKNNLPTYSITLWGNIRIRNASLVFLITANLKKWPRLKILENIECGRTWIALLSLLLTKWSYFQYLTRTRKKSGLEHSLPWLNSLYERRQIERKVNLTIQKRNFEFWFRTILLKSDSELLAPLLQQGRIFASGGIPVPQTDNFGSKVLSRVKFTFQDHWSADGYYTSATVGFANFEN